MDVSQASCCLLRDTPAAVLCPTCGAGGRPLNQETVLALLHEQARRRFRPGSFRFCVDRACPAVYFDPASGVVFTTADVRAPVFEKEPAGARTVCYCFGENEADIDLEIRLTGSSLAVERVRALVAAGGCACSVQNPNGACCLRDLIGIVSQAENGSRAIK